MVVLSYNGMYPYLKEKYHGALALWYPGYVFGEEK